MGTEKTNKLYLVWIDTNPDDEGGGYFEQHSSIEDCISNHYDGVEIYVASPKLLGRFKKTTKLVRLKKRKKRKA